MSSRGSGLPLGLLAALAASGGGGGSGGSSSNTLGKHKSKLRSVRKIVKIKKRLLKLQFALKSGEIDGSASDRKRGAAHVKACRLALEELDQKSSMDALFSGMQKHRQLLKPTDGLMTSRLASKALAVGFGKLTYRMAARQDQQTDAVDE